MGAANKFDFLYSVQQRKDVKCLTLLVYYARPATARTGTSAAQVSLLARSAFGSGDRLDLDTLTLMPGGTASVESASGSSL